MKRELSRRQFVQAVAFFGAAMTLPASLKKSELPEPQPVIILPEDHPLVLPTDSTLVWMNKQPLTGAYQFRFRIEQDLAMPFGYKYPTHAIGGCTGRIEINFAADSFPQLLNLIRLDRLEIAFAPSHGSCEGYICEVCAASMFDYQMDTVNPAVISTVWVMAKEPIVVSIPELMKHVGVAHRARLVLPSRAGLY